MNDERNDRPHDGDHIDILLVEDEAPDVKLIRRALEKGGLLNTISVVRDGQEVSIVKIEIL